MTDAHERIWVEDERPLGGGVYVWNASNNPSEEAKRYAVEYIRADLVEALDAESRRLREALSECLGALTGGMDGTWTANSDPISMARAALRSTEDNYDD